MSKQITIIEESCFRMKGISKLLLKDGIEYLSANCIFTNAHYDFLITIFC